MRTTIILFWTAAAAVLTAGCHWVRGVSGPVIRGSGVLLKEVRPVSGLDRVTLRGSGKAILIQGEEEGLTIETDANLLPYIESRVVNGCLIVEPKGGATLKPTRGIRYELRFKRLGEISLEGAFEAEGKSVKADTLEARISGSGTIRLDRVEAEELRLSVSGSGKVSWAGSAARQSVRISGSGDYRAGGLRSGEAEARISGSGNVVVWATDRLEARISGSGSVSYYGRPQIVQSISGSGKLRFLGEKP